MLAWEGPGAWREYEGGVQDWLTQSARWRALQAETAPPAAKSEPPSPSRPAAEPAAAPLKKKLSYKEQRELDALPARIEALETEQNELRAALADGSLYQTDLEKAIAMQAREAEIDEELTQALERWESLSL